MKGSKVRERPTAPVRPSARTRLLINAAGAGLWLSGGLWLIFHYFLRSEGEWGPEPHVLEPWWLRVHGAFAFMALWIAGLVFAAHIAGAWATGRRRATGIVLAAWLGLLAATGWLLLYAGDDGAWGLMSPAHWIAGLLLPVGYAVHRWLRGREGRPR